MNYILWLLIGAILTVPFLWYVNNLQVRRAQLALGNGLVVAAFIYVLFALVWGESQWVFIELAGIPLYGLFYWLSLRSSIVWLAAGWLLHPAWDVVLHLVGPGNHIAPAWYVVACISFDIIVAAYILYRFEYAAKNS